jgi:hypothetical protein
MASADLCETLEEMAENSDELLTEFIKEGEVNLRESHGEYNLLGIAVTSDNKLLLCNGDDGRLAMTKAHMAYVQVS